MSGVHRTGVACILGLALLLSTSACGIPTGGAPESIPPSEIPYGLTSAIPETAPATSPPSRPDEPRIYLVAEDDVLVPRGRAVGNGTREEVLDRLVDELAAGPTRTELGDQLFTALPPEVRLSVTAVDGDTATIDISGSGNAPSGLASRRAVGQIVLTATSLPGIGAVLLTKDGVPVEAPLPSGELTSAPLTAEDYTALVTPPSK